MGEKHKIMGKYICICGRYSKSVIKLLFFINMNEFGSFVSIFYL